MSHLQPPADMKKRIREAIENRPDGPLPYKTSTRKADVARRKRKNEWRDFEKRRAQLTEHRIEDIDILYNLHSQLRDMWKENGVIVHEARDAAEARTFIRDITKKARADKILKSKTMLSEEIELNNYLADQGIESIETDLGEYIVQLRDEVPSHITMPAMHLNRKDVGRLFAEKLGVEYTEDPPKLTRIARETLRKEFLAAKVGLCGVNFAVAETGHLATVTNEGNGRMVTSLPRVVIALMGWERVTRSLSELMELWQFLARSATGQRATVYLNMLAGPSPGPTGPDEVHVVIVDNGRKKMYTDPVGLEMIRCIRCGACLNSCPVYQQVGGHPFGGVYPGPMGSVLTPLLQGIQNAPDHPHASTLCGECEQVCPVSIPLPKLMLSLRSRGVESNLKPGIDDAVWNGFLETMNNRKRYESISSKARAFQRFVPGLKIRIPGWTDHRDTPSLAPKSFRQLFGEEENE